MKLQRPRSGNGAQKDIPAFGVGKVSLKAIEVSIGKVIETTNEVVRAFGEVAMAIEGNLEVLGAVLSPSMKLLRWQKG